MTWWLEVDLVNIKSSSQSLVWLTASLKFYSASHAYRLQDLPVIAVICYFTLRPRYLQVLKHVLGERWLHLVWHCKDDQLSFLSLCSTFLGGRHCSWLLWPHLQSSCPLDRSIACSRRWSRTFFLVFFFCIFLYSGIFWSLFCCLSHWNIVANISLYFFCITCLAILLFFMDKIWIIHSPSAPSLKVWCRG